MSLESCGSFFLLLVGTGNNESQCVSTEFTSDLWRDANKCVCVGGGDGSGLSPKAPFRSRCQADQPLNDLWQQRMQQMMPHIFASGNS